MSRRLVVLLAALVGLVGLPAASVAEQAWIKDEVRVHKRTGAGTKYRILGQVKTGDVLEVRSRAKEWTQVRDASGDAWIPAGYLQSEPPARVQLEQYIAEGAQMRSDHGALTSEVQELRTENTALAGQVASLDQLAKKFERENFELKAGARWPEWISGASILLVGGLLGIIVHASTGRRQQRRIRL